MSKNKEKLFDEIKRNYKKAKVNKCNTRRALKRLGFKTKVINFFVKAWK